MELWDLYYENREPAGTTHVRGQDIPQGLYHLVVHVWIRNSRGEYIISQRSADRPSFPLMWECVGGSAISGESSADAALREVKEEIGIDLPADSGKIVYSVVRKTINGVRYADILDAWLFEYDGEINLNNVTSNEATQAKWMNREEIRILFNEKKLVHTLEYFFEKIEGI